MVNGEIRVVGFQTGEVYHVFNKSIAGFTIFNTEVEFLRMVDSLEYYQIEDRRLKFSKFIQEHKGDSKKAEKMFCLDGKEKLIVIIAYCIMPTHFHLVLKQLKNNGIPIFVNNILNSYTRYFNIKHNRKGPLWEGRSKRTLIDGDDQLLHLTRYIHLNPITAYLVNKPEEWLASSYKEYTAGNAGKKICKFSDILDINPDSYKEFTESNISYQRDLAKLKSNF